MGDYGLKVSQPGYDVKTAADNELVFSSKFGTWASMCVVATGLVSGSDNFEVVFNIAHNLGYVPFVLLYYVNENQPSYWQWTFSGQTQDILPLNFPTPSFLDVYSDVLIQKFSGIVGGEDVTMRYFIFNAGITP